VFGVLTLQSVYKILRKRCMQPWSSSVRPQENIEHDGTFRISLLFASRIDECLECGAFSFR